MQQMKNKAQGRSDIFQTSAQDIDPIMPYLPTGTIWEPACGQGNIVKYFSDHGIAAVGTDIQNGFDFLDPLATLPVFDCIVTNPPYSTKDEWLQRCYDLGKPFALLLPITALAGKKRGRMFAKHGIQLIMLPGRPTFVTPNGKTGGSWFDCAWFCHGFNLPQQIMFPETV